MEISNKKERNAFIALCEYASKYNWCWKICCTTCGHSAFIVSLAKVARGQHPDNEEFWPYGKENHSPLKELADYNDFQDRYNLGIQEKLAVVVAQAKLFDIQAISNFPDWLGYIGIVLYHCPNSNATKIISDSFIPQFISMLESNKSDYEWLKEPDKILSIKDLELIECRLYKNN